MAAPKSDDMPDVVQATATAEAPGPDAPQEGTPPPGHKGTKAEAAVELAWRTTGVVPSGHGVNFDYDPPIFKLPAEQVARLEKTADDERARAEALADLLAGA